MATDRIKVTILENGVVKIETDAISTANHTSAEGAIRSLQALLGGPATLASNGKKAHTHTHVGTHSHIGGRH